MQRIYMVLVRTAYSDRPVEHVAPVQPTGLTVHLTDSEGWVRHARNIEQDYTPENAMADGGLQ